MQKAILDMHWAEWSPLLGLWNQVTLYNCLAQTPTIVNFWRSRVDEFTEPGLDSWAQAKFSEINALPVIKGHVRARSTDHTREVAEKEVANLQLLEKAKKMEREANQKELEGQDVERAKFKREYLAAKYSSEELDVVIKRRSAKVPGSTSKDRSIDRSIDRSRPTFIKVDRKYMSPETLDAYQLPWEWDAVSPNHPCTSYLNVCTDHMVPGAESSQFHNNQALDR